MNDYKLTLLIMKNKARLDKLVREEADYSKILKQSVKLDKLIAQKMVEQIEEMSSKIEKNWQKAWKIFVLVLSYK